MCTRSTTLKLGAGLGVGDGARSDEPVAVDRGAVGAQLEAGEERRPLLVDRVRVGLPAPILLGDVFHVGERDRSEPTHRGPF